MTLFQELKRRNVFRIAAAYVAGSWLLIQVLETLFPIYGLSETALQVVVTVLAMGLLPALVLAWVFELTPRGLKRDSAQSRAESLAMGTSKWVDQAIIVLLLLAVGYFAFDKFVLDPVRDREVAEDAAQRARSETLLGSYADRSIAVLAFDDLSPEGNQEYFSDGVSEELLNLLARIPELRVAGRTSAFSFKGKEVTIPEIADALKVAHVVEGSVRQSGNRVRITVQLNEARSDTNLWTETYDRELGDIFAIQDEIAAMVVRQMQPLLVADLPRVRRTDPATYQLFLRAKMRYRQEGNSQVIEDVFAQIADRDPRYLPAWTMLAGLYWYRTGPTEYHAYPYEVGIRKFRNAIDRALAIDPNDGVANNLLGWQFLVDGNLEAVARQTEKAVMADPGNSDVLRGASGLARAMGQFELAIEMGRRAWEIDPLAGYQWSLAICYMFADRPEEAKSAIEAYKLLNPDAGWQIHGDILLLNGDAAAALDAYDGGMWPDPAARARALHTLGRRAEFEAAMAEVEAARNMERYVRVARTYAWAGMPDDAFRWMEQGLRASSRSFAQQFLPLESHHPMWRGVHDDPRWAELWAHAGVAQGELAAIELEIDLPE